MPRTSLALILQAAFDEAISLGLGGISDIVLQADSVPYFYVGRTWEVPSATFLPKLANLSLTSADIDDIARDLRARNSERATLARYDSSDLQRIRDFAFSWPTDGPPMWRVRANIVEVSRGPEISLRIHPYVVPDFSELNLPTSILRSVEQQSGLIIVAGPTGGGKSTTIASLVRHYAEQSTGRISTLEDPIEFLFSFPGRLISQQWVPIHTPTFLDGIQDALRRKVDLLVVGELRTPDAIMASIHAASAGHLVIASCHPTSAVSTLDYLSQFAPAEARETIRASLLNVVNTIVCQDLLPGLQQAVVPWYEVVVMSDDIRANLATQQINVLSTLIDADSYAALGNVSGRRRLEDLLRRGQISEQTYRTTQGHLR